MITLHSSDTYPSLNLSHAVAVVLHDIARLQTVLNSHPNPFSSAQRHRKQNPQGLKRWKPASMMLKSCCWKWAS